MFNLILFGFKGCGKTFFGKKWAKNLGWPFIDTDECIQKLYSQQEMTLRQIYTQLGEIRFRALEKHALFSLKHVQQAVIAVGGGAVLDVENRAFLQTLGKLIYLKTSPQTLQKRMKQLIDKEGVPPVLGVESENWEARFRVMIEERTPIYEGVASTHVEIENLEEPEVLSFLQFIKP